MQFFFWWQVFSRLAQLTLVCVDARTQKAIGVPEAIRRKLEETA